LENEEYEIVEETIEENGRRSKAKTYKISKADGVKEFSP